MNDVRFWVLSLFCRFNDPDIYGDEYSQVVGVYSSIERAQEAAQNVIDGEIFWCDIWEQDPYHVEQCNTDVPLYYDGDDVVQINIDGHCLDVIQFQTVVLE